MRTPDPSPVVREFGSNELAAMAALADAVRLLVASAMERSEKSYAPEHRTILAVDIVGFNGPERDDEVQLAIRHALYRTVSQAFDAAGIPWRECHSEDRGDGVVVLLPARVPAATAAGPLLQHLRAGIRRHNRLASELARIRLRVAVHAGEVHRDEYGLAGAAITHVFRLLEAPAFKEMAARGGEIAVIVSGALYDSVVRHGPGLVDPDAYRPVIAALKETHAPAWVHLPGDEPESAEVGLSEACGTSHV